MPGPSVPKPGQEIVFHVEVPSARGLPRPERTFVRLSGLGLSLDLPSEPLQDGSDEPGGWLFHDPEALAEIARLKAEAEAVANSKDKKAKGAPPPVEAPPLDPPQPVCRIARPCGSHADRQLLLDSVCSPLRVTLLRCGETPVVLGEALLELSGLIHETASLELDVELRWSQEMISELRTQFEEEVAAAAEAAAAAKAEAEAAAAAAATSATPDGEAASPTPEDGESEEAAPEPEAPVFEEPALGRLVVRVSTAGPIGRILCPEDLNDWAVLSVNLEGCYHLPQPLLEAGGALPAPGTFEGPLDTHPLGYSIRLLGCEFDGGRLVLPHVDLPTPVEGGEPPRADSATGSAALEAEVAEGSGGAATPEGEPVPSFHIGREEFVEGLMRAGFAAAQEDGPAVFDFLGRPRTGLGGRIGPQEFSRLAELAVPAPPKKLLAFREFLVEKHGQLDEAFDALDSAAEGSLSLESFVAGLEALGRPEDAEALFVAIDTQRTGTVCREDLRTLGVHKKLADLQLATKAAKWLLASTGSVQALTQQVDQQKTGQVTKESFLASAEQLGYPDTVGAALVFACLDPDQAGFISSSSLELLTKIDAAAAATALPKLEDLVLGGEGLGATGGLGGLGGEGAGKAALAKLLADTLLLPDDEAPPGLSCADFVNGCTLLGAESLGVHPQLLFFLLDSLSCGRVGAAELAALPAFNAAARWQRLAACRSFIEVGVGSIDQEAFKRLFDDRSEYFSEAEESLPRVEWTKKLVHGYRGREWLQRLLNTLGDERGRQGANGPEASCGGAWLYLFPLVQGQSQAVDFKDVQDPAQAGHAKLARWHHAQAFLDLRRLAATAPDGSGPELEFRAFLTQVGPQPAGLNDAGELPTPYGTCQAYVKGTIRLDRPLLRLCPRDVRAPLRASGEPYIPPPPARRPPPTVKEELEREAGRVVGRLAAEFARMCHEHGLEEQQIVGPGGRLSEDPILGRKGVRRHMFVDWLEEQSGGSALRDLGAELRPAIVRLIRMENKDGPACGLSGNENDARYTYLTDYIMQHLFRALNHDVECHRRRRDERLWRSPPFVGDLTTVPNAQDPDAAPETPEQQREQDAQLTRLTFEYELLGDIARARELHEERLALEMNQESGEAWYGYARFLMRCSRSQPDAEQALRFVISLRPPEEGPSLREAAFLACLLQNHSLPCSLDGDERRSARFEAARALLEDYADRHSGEQVPLYFLFAVYALEAWGLQAEMAAAAEGATQLHGDSPQGPSAAEESADRIARLSAAAAKYLELARAGPEIFNGTLNSAGPAGRPSFPALESLVHIEQVNRGETVVVPEGRPVMPAAWQPPAKPALPDPKSIRSFPDPEDSTSLSCVDLLLHFGLPSLVRFLLQEAVEAFGFISPATAASERCRIQLIKAAMMAGDWAETEALVSDLFARRGGDRTPEAHALLGECRYRAAREATATGSGYEAALSAFEAALSFLPAPEASLEAPEVRMRIYIEKAEKLAGDTISDKLDPYCIVKLGDSKRFQTPVQWNVGVNPKVDYNGVLILGNEEHIEFTVMEKDKHSADDLCGTCSMAVSELYDGYRGSVRLTRPKEGILKDGENLEEYAGSLFIQVRYDYEKVPALTPTAKARRPPQEDPVLHLRVASILHTRAEESGFTEIALVERAVDHYKRSLLVAPTAEAWKSVGVCTYHRARLQPAGKKRERLLKEATRYLTEANVLDRERPQINAWLVICAVELGHEQIAKQGIRQVRRFEDRLDSPTTLELASLLLRFSDEQRAAEWGGERGRLVKDGCYATEAADMARMVLARGDNGKARHILARSLALRGEDGAAAAEFCAALPLLALEDPTALEEAAQMARLCAARLPPGEQQLAMLVEEAIEVAFEQQLSQGVESAEDLLAPVGEMDAEADETTLQDEGGDDLDAAS